MCRVRVIHDTQDHVPDAVTRQLSDKAVVTRVRDFVCVLKMLITCSSSNTADYLCMQDICALQSTDEHATQLTWTVQDARMPRLGPERHLPRTTGRNAQDESAHGPR